jgi:predicted acyl esterase
MARRRHHLAGQAARCLKHERKQFTAKSKDLGFELVMRPGMHPKLYGAPDALGQFVSSPHPGPDHEIRREHGLLIERNIAVAMRDGLKILIDLYRPDGIAGERDLPVVLGWSPYGKHNLSDRLWPAADVQESWISQYTAFEAPDPLYWCNHGYAVIYPDPRGTWYSEGEMHHGGVAEGEDCYDLIEWAAAQPWSNGKVGMSGVSYLTTTQWQVAPLKPPHLAAINPWEGFSDWHREFGYHGGMRDTGFIPRSASRIGWSTTRTEDTPANMLAHPLYDAYWKSKEYDLADIEVPAFVVASWSDQGLHTRGTLEAFKKMASKQKWLEVHGQKKWYYYYRPDCVEKQRRFFDHFLKGVDNDVLSWPKVNIEVRERAWVGNFRTENEWPLARTKYRKLFLDAGRAALLPTPVATLSEIRYDPLDGQAVFDYAFPEDTELTGHMKLRLWAETDAGDDMDLFIAIQKYDAQGKYVPFVFYSVCDNGPVALGWLRASHRELDVVRSTPEQPIHPHSREQRLTPGVAVPLEIEIWSSSTLFRKRERLRVLVRGQDIYTEMPPGPAAMRHEDLRNKGMHILRTGGKYDAHLLVPVIAPA